MAVSIVNSVYAQRHVGANLEVDISLDWNISDIEGIPEIGLQIVCNGVESYSEYSACPSGALVFSGYVTVIVPLAIFGPINSFWISPSMNYQTVSAGAQNQLSTAVNVSSVFLMFIRQFVAVEDSTFLARDTDGVLSGQMDFDFEATQTFPVNVELYRNYNGVVKLLKSEVTNSQAFASSQYSETIMGNFQDDFSITVYALVIWNDGVTDRVDNCQLGGFTKVGSVVKEYLAIEKLSIYVSQRPETLDGFEFGVYGHNLLGTTSLLGLYNIGSYVGLIYVYNKNNIKIAELTAVLYQLNVERFSFQTNFLISVCSRIQLVKIGDYWLSNVVEQNYGVGVSQISKTIINVNPTGTLALLNRSFSLNEINVYAGLVLKYSKIGTVGLTKSITIFCDRERYIGHAFPSVSQGNTMRLLYEWLGNGEYLLNSVVSYFGSDHGLEYLSAVNINYDISRGVIIDVNFPPVIEYVNVEVIKTIKLKGNSKKSQMLINEFKQVAKQLTGEVNSVDVHHYANRSLIENKGVMCAHAVTMHSNDQGAAGVPSVAIFELGGVEIYRESAQNAQFSDIVFDKLSVSGGVVTGVFYECVLNS